MMIMKIDHLSKRFDKSQPKVINKLSFHLNKGECVGLVGESGCGKSTVAKLMTRLLEADEGSVLFKGKDIKAFKNKELKNFYGSIQMIFQMPQQAFNPRQTIGSSLIEVMRNYQMNKKQAREKALELLEQVSLSKECFNQYPHQLSGGQCQRAAIARALSVEPDILICDEATSALDVITQKEIIILLKKLQQERELSLLVISHDPLVIQNMCERVLVMEQGRITREKNGNSCN